MKTRKSLYPICLTILLLGLFGVGIPDGYAKLQTKAPKGWPEQLGKRKLYPADRGFIYAGSKSSVAKVDEIVEKVVKDLDTDGMTMPAKGLILVLGKKEEPPFEAEALLAMFAKKQSEQKDGEDLEKSLEALEDGKKEMEELGLDMNLLLTIAPMPIEPNMLPELIKGFPKDIDRQIEWCVTMPTESNIRYGMKKMLDAGLKKKKVGIVEQVALFPLLAFAENKAVSELKQARQSALYQYIIDKQDHLTKEQKEEKIKACEERLWDIASCLAKNMPDFDFAKVQLGFRIHNPADEQEAAGLVVADKEEERMVGPENRRPGARRH